MSAMRCRFGRACPRPECSYAHPDGRDLDLARPRRDQPPPGALCKWGRLCRRRDCEWTHPEGREVDREPDWR